jgi:N-acyl-D-aspartate/D-glutamate deacylase
MHDLIVRNGLVVDGTPGLPYDADVAVDDGVITALGAELGPARRIIDASGCVVSPGFIDPHTHLDAQLFWDPSGAPSACHGVTTVVLSACGFGLAPCRDEDAEVMLRALSVVEEIPYESMLGVVPMSWRSWSEYFDALANLPLGVNVSAFLGHSPLRQNAMGERAWHEAATTEDERQLMATAEAALAAGALGLSTSRGPNHVDALGRPLPSRVATDHELQALVGVCHGRPWQINLRAKDAGNVTEAMAEMDAYGAWTEAAGARMSWTPLLARLGNWAWRELLHHNRNLVQRGTSSQPQVSPRPISVSLSFDGECRALHGIEGWQEAFRGWDRETVAARRERARSTEFRRILSTNDPVLFGCGFGAWIIAASPAHPELVDHSIASAYSGPHAVEELLDSVIADDFRTVLHVPIANTDHDAVIELIRDEHTLLGLGDSGAHTSANTSYSYPSYLLARLVRDQGALSLEEAVHALSAQPAAYLGITDRGTIQLGQAADLCIFDLARLEPTPPVLRHDLPQGYAHLDQRARGFRAVLVNGRATIEDDVLLGVGAGRTIRGSST